MTTVVCNPTLVELQMTNMRGKKSIAYLLWEFHCCHQAKNQVNFQQLTREKRRFACVACQIFFTHNSVDITKTSNTFFQHLIQG